MQCSFCGLSADDCMPCPDCQEQRFFCLCCRNAKTNLCPVHDGTLKSDMDTCSGCGAFAVVYACGQCERQNLLCEECIDCKTLLCKDHSIQNLASSHSMLSKMQVVDHCDWCHPLAADVKSTRLIIHPRCDGVHKKEPGVHAMNAITATTHVSKHVYCDQCYDKMDERVCILDCFEPRRK